VVALIGMAVVVTFSVLLPRLRFRSPRILHDVVFTIVSCAAVFFIASQSGYNLSGIIATSAVLTAIIGFSLQGTLGNIVSGLALQLDGSIHVGDWIQVGEDEGRVTDIRWRHVEVETRDWETLIIPNAELSKETVRVVGRRVGEPEQVRRTIEFRVDYRQGPADVVRVVEKSLKAKIPGVARKPKPHVLLMDFGESFGVYGARYWLTNFQEDQATDSRVRTRIYFGLLRAGIPLSRPAHSVFLTDTSKRHAEKRDRHVGYRMDLLASVDLFATLEESERQYLVDHLSYTPFARDEVIVEQGEEGHYLYLMTSGSVEMRLRVGEQERVVRDLGAPNYFGEMALLTGDPRMATIVALTDCECYRLDKPAFQRIIGARPEIAEQVAGLLAHRRMETDQVRQEMGDAAIASDMEVSKWELVSKIRRFFSLET
jgi:small-conductance mechanosensitive channel